ncbi:cell elongation-specific peptidoglycan biosynthesis regulator RodA [Mariprofundus ferrinatatus]|uniref:Peptidoglycan glycosyltransferase MrdB n=1 Tax=Mariprofundus ferrinatatus TaxID=1921087 RepID=A0A2K8L0X5_9PROT|nr:rod shape-determining protein RodA [Mariprofundus ferrinatatus]ATX80948.1 cell elongation-specific peptidoglycan biosynthesis regulator RodA [Mariprofundus ferrinatatus]
MIFRALRSVDWILLASVASLITVGLITLYAAIHQGDALLWKKQLIFLSVGFSVFLLLCFIPLRFLGLASWPFYIVALILLALVPLVGDVQMGARRWLDLGVINLQPSELMKWALMFVLAHWFASREADSMANLAIALMLAVAPAALIVIQPDLGTTLVLLFAASAMLIASGLPWRWFGIAVVLALASLPVLWNFIMHDYQKRRVLTLLDPQSDPLGAGYHVIQSTIAIGSGGLFGKGYMQGTQASLHFLPEQHTDFIFAVLAEEGGFVAATILLVLYTILITRILMISYRAHSRFGSLVCIGVASVFLLYISVNIGMVSGLLPVVGLPLPFISYGGSALVTMLAALGLVMRVAIESKDRIPWQRPGSPLL